MSMTIKSENKYLCEDKNKLKELMKEEGFIFKNSTMQRDEYFVDIHGKLLSKDSCIRIRIVNDKRLVLSFNGNIENVSSLDVKEADKVFLDIAEYGNIVSFLADLGYYKYVSINVLKETYVKKEKEYYYSISIDTIEEVGEFIDYDVYTEEDNEEKTKEIFKKFEETMNSCLGEEIKLKYRDYSAQALFNTKLKGNYVKKILVELEKIFINLDQNNIEESIKNKYTILNLELIEKLEHLGIDVSIVYSNPSSELVENIKGALSKMGYSPKFMNIKEIKEIAVRETLIIENQKKISFNEVGMIISNFYNP
ncbi:MAG: CYTH domain-containing protein [Clostridia bacterium]|nr:CYTH domain-containing protein [Clostridia bacterium]